MAGFEEQLNAILGDPQAMSQIVSMARSLTGGGSSGPAGTPEPPPPPPEGFEPVEPPPPAAPPPELSELRGLLEGLSGGADGPLSLLGGLDPALVERALRILSGYRAGDDRKAALLTALKPFLKEERQAKIDRAVAIARLSRLVRAALQLFGKEDTDHGPVL
ncbi:hypothetical protein [Pseudoflavonifractor sp. MSJ-37]|uniref:hypothetical protein n=1 Tax=Pseudoflavonifractor sp. MSJ-37 TaxID=2841531 RepID=UPI001C0FF52C|nr:hypothetical protein [Pseudoflavonifractor sp. MSJ-37]MBU5434530.1 hypothetical protein [Pseudoflavonifractor sp. MSJ-37]